MMKNNPLHTRLCEEYGCETPIVAFSSTKEVVAAASNAGGIGILGATAMKPDELRSAISYIRNQIGDKPFGVDLLVPASFVEGNSEDLKNGTSLSSASKTFDMVRQPRAIADRISVVLTS